MIKYNNTNNASTTLTAGISASSTTLIVENGDILPTAPFLLTLEHFDNEKVTVREIVKCIAKVGTILTIQRGAGTCVQDDTATPKAQNNTPHSFSVGDCASIYWTSEQVQDIQNEIEKKLNIDDFQAGTYVYGATSTGTDAYSITIPGTLTSYSVGQVFRFMADTENTGNATLNVNGIGEKEILKNHDQHLQSGDIEAGQIVEVAYDGTNFQMDSQIASVISLDDISSLSYKDTTCYAGEEIHENDLIVTNGNSFNPDRADESTDVGGQTVNKYAIGFIGNGESTDTFLIKTSVIEGFEPDSVTVNIESDDNGKPSGTALDTFEGINSFKWHGDPTSFVNYDGDYFGVSTVYPGTSGIIGITNIYGLGYGQIYSRNSGTNTILGINTPDGEITMDFGLTSEVGVFLRNSNDGKKIVLRKTYNTITIYHCVNPFSLERATTNDFTFSEVTVASGSGIGKMLIMEGGKNALIYNDVTDVYDSPRTSKKFFIHTETPYDFSTYNTQELSITHYYLNYTYMYKDNKHYLYCEGVYSNSHDRKNYEIGDDGTITVISTTDLGIYGYFTYYGEDTLLIKPSNMSMKEMSYITNYIPRKIKFHLTNSLALTQGEKYRLTIAPVVTGSVVDSIKIYDKEGEYYSECAVRDLNSWSNVADKTPYIDSNCIKARYARKVNTNDKLEKIPFGFANGDFTELESVQYTFQGLKTGFSDLTTDSLYYSNGNGGITRTIGQYVVGKSADENTLNIYFTPTSYDLEKPRQNTDFYLWKDAIMVCDFSHRSDYGSVATCKIKQDGNDYRIWSFGGQSGSSSSTALLNQTMEYRLRGGHTYQIDFNPSAIKEFYLVE